MTMTFYVLPFPGVLLYRQTEVVQSDLDSGSQVSLCLSFLLYKMG